MAEHPIIPSDRRYTTEHEWILPDQDVHVVGISAFAQDQLGDIVYVELPKPGDRIEAGKTFGVVESVKTASDLYAPISGTVSAVNERLVDEPQLVNDAPYGDGWMIRVVADDSSALELLMTSDDYARQIGA